MAIPGFLGLCEHCIEEHLDLYLSKHKEYNSRQCWQLTNRVGWEGIWRRLRLFGLKVGNREAGDLGMGWKCVQSWFACAEMQARVWGGRLLLLLFHQQSLSQLPLVLLDLLLHVIDCTCNLQEDMLVNTGWDLTYKQTYFFWFSFSMVSWWH